MARQIVFYSWQSDRPNNTNRGLIQTALERAANSIRKDQSLQVEPVIERDTAGVAGSPDIASTIFGKIETADVFVADVSLVTEDVAGRQTPNPNVLLELGFAVKALGWNRVILVINDRYGGPELLPFDLRMRRAIPYTAHEDDDTGRRSGRESLQSNLERSLRDIIEKHGAPSAGETVRPLPLIEVAAKAISDSRVDRSAHIRRYVESFVNELDSLAPDLARQGLHDDELVTALEAATAAVNNFIRLVRAASDMKDAESMLNLHRAIELLAARQFTPRGFSGTVWNLQFDFWRFIVNECFVSMVAIAVSAEMLETAKELIDTPLIVPNNDEKAGVLEIRQLCRPVITLIERDKAKKLNRVSVQADLLKERRSRSPELTIEQYRQGDIFIFFAVELKPEQAPSIPEWRPYSVLFEFGAPQFLIRAISKNKAERLATVLGLSVEQLKTRIAERMWQAVRIYGDGAAYVEGPLGTFDVNLLGSR